MFGLGGTTSSTHGFQAYAVDFDKPFLSETGYRSFVGYSPEIAPGMTPADVAREVLSTDLRPSRYRRPLAARAFSQVLGTSFQEEPATSRQTRDGSRDSTSD